MENAHAFIIAGAGVLAGLIWLAILVNHFSKRVDDNEPFGP